MVLDHFHCKLLSRFLTASCKFLSLMKLTNLSVTLSEDLPNYCKLLEGFHPFIENFSVLNLLTVCSFLIHFIHQNHWFFLRSNFFLYLSNLLHMNPFQLKDSIHHKLSWKRKLFLKFLILQSEIAKLFGPWTHKLLWVSFWLFFLKKRGFFL